MKKLQLTTIAVVTTALFAGSAMADEYSYKGFYTGFGVGTAQRQVKQNVEYYDRSTNQTEHTNIKVKGNDLAFNFYVGYNITNWLALEGSYLHAGTTDAKSYIRENGEDLDSKYMTGRLKTGAWTVAPKFTAHLGDIFAVYAKVGLAYVDGTLESTTNGNALSVSDSHLGYTYGAGVEATVTPNVTLRLAYDGYTADLNKFTQSYIYQNGDASKTSDARTSADFLTFNVQYNF